MFDFVSFIPRAIMQGIPLLFGSTGETLTEKSGNLNLGIAGIMYVGGISGVIGAFLYEQAAGGAAGMNGFLAIMIPLLSCLLGSLLMGLLYCFLTVTLRANQNVTGLAMTTFGVGFGNFMGGSLIKLTGSEVPSIALSATNSYFSKSLPFASKLGWFGQIFLSYGFLAYLAVAIALIAAYVLKHTRVGLHLRSVGENPQTADAAGIDVNKYKYIATCVGSMIAGLGGLYYVMDYACGVWSNDAFGDRGWLAIALVIFTVWKPNVGVLASFLFGGLYILHIFLPSGTNLAVKELYKMIPYVVTIIVLIITSVRSKRENQPPQASACRTSEKNGNARRSGNIRMQKQESGLLSCFCMPAACRRGQSRRERRAERAGQKNPPEHVPGDDFLGTGSGYPCLLPAQAGSALPAFSLRRGSTAATAPKSTDGSTHAKPSSNSGSLCRNVSGTP